MAAAAAPGSTSPLVSTRPRSALIRFPLDGVRQWLRFDNPVGWVVASNLDEVRPALREVQVAQEQGYWAVGMVSYDAGPAFDPAVAALRHHGVPLVAFGFYRDATPSGGPGAEPGTEYGQFGVSGWAPSRSQVEHALCIAAIKEAIARGDTYQVNQTFRLRSRFTGDPMGLFAALARAQPTDYLAYLDLGRAAVCSASPEMFFERHGDRVITRPMKGTRPRQLDERLDEAMVEELLASEKDLAENTMIVDMARNDLGRIAEIGSIEVTDLHTVESYPTVHQLTSTVTARTTADIPGLFDAMFPAASITGAPKFSTTEIIAELEREPRGIYTGTVGAISPDGTAVFNVAIRTAWVDRLTNSAEYGIGGGIVWDSTAESEWREALDKARILSRAKPDLKLLETMRWDADGGVVHLDRHLQRLQHSAHHFGYDIDMVTVKEQLNLLDERAEASGPLRVRLLVDWEGIVELTTAPLGEPTGRPYRAMLDHLPVDTDNEFLYHKTTERSRYNEARARMGASLEVERDLEIDDVILWNEHGEATETTIGNLVVSIDGRLVTPPVSCGLLPGTMRAELLAEKSIVEGVIHLADLRRADEIFMINSVRGWTRVELVIDD